MSLLLLVVFGRLFELVVLSIVVMVVRQASKNEVLMDSGVNIRIGMTAAQNDERGDQGLARTVDKKS